MININTYVTKFGTKSFKKMPFNEVDGLIFAQLSMINFELLLNGKETIAFKDIVIKNFKKTTYGSPDARSNGIMLKRMIKSTRYQNVRVGYPRRVFNTNPAIQFYAVTFLLPDGTIYLSFKGTDITLIGWEEDIYMTYMDKLYSHDEAVSYTNEVLSRVPGNCYIGGHSKGGNLAVYAAMNMDQVFLNRLIDVYSYDGPGFPNGLEQFPNCAFVYNKIKKFITHRDMVGVIYHNVPYYKIVYSPGMLLGGHDPFSWKINDKTGEFVTREKRLKKYETFGIGANMWVNQMSVEDKMLGCQAIVKILGRAKNIYDLIKYLGQNVAKFSSVVKKNFSKEEQARLRRNVSSYFECMKLAKTSKSLQARTILVTKRLIIREMVDDDYDALADIISDPETMKYYPRPYDEEGVWRWIIWCKDSYKTNGFGLWSVVLKDTGEMIGDCGVSMQKINNSWKPEIGYHLNKKYHQQGIGKEMTQAVKDYFFIHYQYDEVYSYMNVDNVPSYKTAEANGMTFQFEYTPKNDSPHRVYRITREEWKNEKRNKGAK